MIEADGAQRRPALWVESPLPGLGKVQGIVFPVLTPWAFGWTTPSGFAMVASAVVGAFYACIVRDSGHRVPMGVIRTLWRRLYRPFQGFREKLAVYPRLKPWAIVSRPLRGGNPVETAQLGCSFGFNPGFRAGTPPLRPKQAFGGVRGARTRSLNPDDLCET